MDGICPVCRGSGGCPICKGRLVDSNGLGCRHCYKGGFPGSCLDCLGTGEIQSEEDNNQIRVDREKKDKPS